jgi:hypothetical protein
VKGMHVRVKGSVTIAVTIADQLSIMSFGKRWKTRFFFARTATMGSISRK